MPAIETYEIVPGTTSTITVQLYDNDGNKKVGYAGTEARSLQVWPGGTEAAVTLSDSSVAWSNPTLGQVALTAGPTDSAALASQALYLFRILITEGASQYERARGYLKTLPVPGAGTTGKTYCDYADMILHAPWIERLSNANDQAGFQAQRERARCWLDDTILNSDRPDWGWFGRTKDDAHFGGTNWGYNPLGGDVPPDKWLRDQLAADYLIVRDWVKQATARMAIYFVCEPQLGEAVEGTSYQALGNRNRVMAEQLVLGQVFEVDLNGDGYADRWGRIGKKSTR